MNEEQNAAERLAALEERQRGDEMRLDSLEKLTESVRETVYEIRCLRADVNELKARGIKRYETAVAAAIAAAVTACVTYLAQAMIR